MNAAGIKIGWRYSHKTHGQCVVTHRNRAGFWIQVWGGISGDKLYTFKGIDGADLSTTLATCRECL